MPIKSVFLRTMRAVLCVLICACFVRTDRAEIYRSRHYAAGAGGRRFLQQAGHRVVHGREAVRPEHAKPSRAAGGRRLELLQSAYLDGVTADVEHCFVQRERSAHLTLCEGSLYRATSYIFCFCFVVTPPLPFVCFLRVLRFFCSVFFCVGPLLLDNWCCVL